LSDFANRFLGFGSLKGKFWLIGPEPGGGYTPEDVCHRALVWSARGRREADDLHGYHSDLKRELEASKLQSDFDWIRRIQPTWGPLIRVMLAIDEQGEEIDREDVRIFQATQFGRFNGQNGVFELLPFSSPTQADWRLGSLGISWLRTRSDYEARWVPMRCNLLRMKVANYKARLVLFYGNNSEQLDRWCRISPCSFTSSKEVEQLLIARIEGTLFAIIPHPVNLNRRLHDKGRGAVKKFLANVDAALRKELI
jgi:hypothetical protein